MRALTAWLHLQQPAARLTGRLRHGLTPWRRRGQASTAWPAPRTVSVWRETWRAAEDILAAVDADLRSCGAVVRHGDAYCAWDLAVRGGLLGDARLRLAVEEHGAGRQLLRFRVWPRVNPTAAAGVVLAGVLGVLALIDSAHLAGAVLLAVAGLASILVASECRRACGLCVRALAEMKADDDGG